MKEITWVGHCDNVLQAWQVGLAVGLALVIAIVVLSVIAGVVLRDRPDDVRGPATQSSRTAAASVTPRRTPGQRH